MKVAPALSQAGAAKVTDRLDRLALRAIVALKDGVTRRAVMVTAVRSPIRQVRAVMVTREIWRVAPMVIGPVRKVAGSRAISGGPIWLIAAVVRSPRTAMAVEKTAHVS